MSKESIRDWRQIQKEQFDKEFQGLSNDDLYNYASNPKNDSYFRKGALSRTKFDFERTFNLMKQDNFNYSVLIFLEQIEDNSTQEQLGEVAKWLAYQKSVRSTTVEVFCQYITDEKVIKDIIENVRHIAHHSDSIISGLNDQKKYSKDNPFPYRY